MTAEQPTDLWIDRVADAESRKSSQVFYERALAHFVTRYEEELEYLKAIATALQRGQSVSIWELLDAALSATGESHPCEKLASEALERFDNNTLDRDACKQLLSEDFKLVRACREAIERLAEKFSMMEANIEGLAASRNIELDSTRTKTGWQAMLPNYRRQL